MIFGGFSSKANSTEGTKTIGSLFGPPPIVKNSDAFSSSSDSKPNLFTGFQFGSSAPASTTSFSSNLFKPAGGVSSQSGTGIPVFGGFGASGNPLSGSIVSGATGAPKSDSQESSVAPGGE